MFGFMKKDSRTVNEKLEAERQCVIYNLMDHMAVVSANLYKASTPLCNVTLIDIRDPLAPADTYIWLGVGNRQSLSGYYQKSIEPAELAVIFENSVFIERPGLMRKLSDLVVDRSGGNVEKAPLLAKWCITSELFHEDSKEVERIVRYYKVLELCHAAHTIGSDAAEEIAMMSVESSEEDVNAFRLDQKRINKSFANKIRYITYPVKGNGTLAFIQLNTLDYVGYSILRRVISTGKNFLHQSMGIYGQVIYSNRQFDSSVFNIGNQPALFIQGE